MCSTARSRWKREHDVEIRNGQQIRLPIGEPLGAGRGLALWATAITARVEYFDAMSAPVALIEMTTQDRSPAVADISKGFPLLAREHGVPAGQDRVDECGRHRPVPADSVSFLRWNEAK